MVKQGYSLKDISIIPAYYSAINSRKQVNPYVPVCNRTNMLPIFVAPMATVVNDYNYKTFLNNKVTPVIPRSVDLDTRLKLASETFVSLSLQEAEDFANIDMPEKPLYICIDIANGNMCRMFSAACTIKTKFGDLVKIMAGNIANPGTYVLYCSYGIDYVRVGIGGGSRCTTSCATGIHYPMASLLIEIDKIKKERKDGNKFYTKVIADGGINWYDDINKALALGADAVMMGKMFAECEEACGEAFNIGNKLYRNYIGMSHRSMQKVTGGDGDKVSEGIIAPVEIKYSLTHFIENVESYLRSCMSYTGSWNISDLSRSEIILTNNDIYKK